MSDGSRRQEKESPGVPAFRALLAERLEARREELATRWLRRLQERLLLHPRDVLPSEDLLNHIPEVVASLARNLGRGYTSLPHPQLIEEIGRMARLRLAQGFDLQELVYEYQLLSRILYEVTEEERARAEPEPSAGEALEVASSLDQLVLSLLSVTVGFYEEARFEEQMDVARLLDDYVSTLAHQVRNALQKATTAAEVLASERAADEGLRREYGQRVQDVIQEIAARMDDVRAVALGVGTGRDGTVCLEDVIRATLEDLREEAEAEGVALEAEAPIPSFRVDGPRVQTILMNLVANGVKYADEAKNPRWVRVGARWIEEDEECRVHVTDNGLGIAPEAQKRVFDRFYRAHGNDRHGSGLGLAIAQKAVHQMGGRIWLASEPGAGTTFYFTIPRRHLKTVIAEEEAGPANS